MAEEFYRSPRAPAFGEAPGDEDETQTPDLDRDRRELRMIAIIDETERHYRDHVAPIDARNLSYYRGNFWVGDSGFNAAATAPWTNYKAEQNEIFPVLDTIASALAVDIPQVEYISQRANGREPVDPMDDEHYRALRIAAPLNAFAEMDTLNETVHEGVLNAMIFRKGGIFRTTWDPDEGRIVWELRQPWEVFFDPSARRMRHGRWSFERFPLHKDDLLRRGDDGTYKIRQRIGMDTFPRGLLDDYSDEPQQDDWKRRSLREYVLLHEFWDHAAGIVYHIHVPTRQVLLAAPAPVRFPYEILTFHSGVGRLEGIPDVDVLAPIQQVVNELVSARLEMVRRLQQRMLIEAELFATETEWTSFLSSKTWEPSRVRRLKDRLLKDAIATTPAANTSFDFNQALGGATEHGRYLSGAADFTRGIPTNIRTAEEATMVRQAFTGRMNVRVNLLRTRVAGIFQTGFDFLQWALRHPEEAGFDWNGMHADLIPDVDADTWRDEILSTRAARFKVLPFSPLMRDMGSQKVALESLLPLILEGPLAPFFNPGELARDIQEQSGWRPSVLNKNPQPPPGAAVDPLAGGEGGGLPPDATMENPLLSLLPGGAETVSPEQG